MNTQHNADGTWSEADKWKAEVEQLREALAQCQNTDDVYVYRIAGNALAGRRWNEDRDA